MGFSALSRQAARLRAHLAPEPATRTASAAPRALIRYLRDLRGADRDGADDDLLIGLEGLATERLLRPLFDETLPVPAWRRRSA